MRAHDSYITNIHRNNHCTDRRRLSTYLADMHRIREFKKSISSVYTGMRSGMPSCLACSAADTSKATNNSE